jgi:hypothetical protein
LITGECHAPRKPYAQLLVHVLLRCVFQTNGG